MKNYIEEVMRHSNLKLGEYFLFIENNRSYKVKVRFEKVDGRLRTLNDRDAINDDVLLDHLEGKSFIEKIKLKTLMEQLKEQGFGWCITLNYDIKTQEMSHEICKVNFVDDLNNASINTHNINKKNILVHCEQNIIFLTKSKAEREAYRRKLEFEMQEWARENGCLGNVSRDYSPDYSPFEGFNFAILEEAGTNNLEVIRIKFKEKVEKFYNWKTEE